MLQEIISYISTLDISVIYLVLFFFSFIENLFPPSPSDVVVVIGSTLIANSPVGFIPVLIVTTIASSLGFVVMYYLGEYLGDNLIRKGRFKFIKPDLLQKTDEWFAKYGYNLILINRFMPGTRAVVSFFCGVHKLSQPKTFLYASLSSLGWNIILISLGVALGNNISLIDKYLSTYSDIVFILLILVAGYFLIRFWLKGKRKNEDVQK
jgi:membrane protein DedA with SNARE-associated domain